MFFTFILTSRSKNRWFRREMMLRRDPTKDFKASTSTLRITQVDTSRQISRTKMHDQLFVAWNVKNCFWKIGGLDMSQNSRPCTSSCEFFACGQRSLFFKGKAAWCKFADDECEVKTCKYAQCVKGRLLSSGMCALESKPRPEFEIAPDPTLQPIKAPPKLAQKLKEKELF